ncbi:hypothetical protein HPB50_013961 [Hyalomma asiaticum]|uniref:Uncharacterized protein n=1 Tax=Hyalomma asiaticum TaxID=266040 RepID=A0ACB7THZ2_HYAAI|nr:hypothetical protein HPB50_013961 [Hyalomma asiaticum]
MRRSVSLQLRQSSLRRFVVTQSSMLEVLHRTTLVVVPVCRVDVPCRSPPDAEPRSASSVAQRSPSALHSFADTQRSHAAQLLVPKLTGRLGMSILLLAAHQQVPRAAGVLSASPGFSTFLAAGSPILGQRRSAARPNRLGALRRRRGGGESPPCGRACSSQAVRIEEPPAAGQTEWADRVKGTTPRVRRASSSPPEHSAARMLQLERENASLRNALEQLRAEIDEMKRAGQEQPVQRPLPSVTESVETPTGMPMEIPTETPVPQRSAKKRALSKPILDEGLEELRAELRGFQFELRDALKALSEEFSAINARVDSVESKITITDQLSGSAVRNASPSADSSTVQASHNSAQLASARRTDDVSWPSFVVARRSLLCFVLPAFSCSLAPRLRNPLFSERGCPVLGVSSVLLEVARVHGALRCGP